MMKHLLPKTRLLLELDNDARIIAIKLQKWIPYSRIETLFQRLDRLRTLPISSRFEGLSVYGRSNVGKTMPLRRYAGQYPKYKLEAEGEFRMPVVYVLAPKSANERELYEQILIALGAEDFINSKTIDLARRVKSLLKHLEVKLLIIDEFHHLALGSYRQTQTIFNYIKLLGDHLNISIVTAGLQIGQTAILKDDQLNSRLKEFKIEPFRNDKEYVRLLKSFESLLLLRKPSNLREPTIAQYIFDVTQGLIGYISNLLKLTAEEAIKNGDESITIKLLQEVVKSGLYTLPSKVSTTDVISSEEPK